MNYQSLLYFKTVAELQHYTRAAAALYITQPALSKAIRNLEAELGASLFQKDGRNVSLTPYGSLFYAYVKPALEEIDRGMAAVRHQVDLENNTIFISATFTMYTSYLPERILAFRRLYPQYRFSPEYKYTTAVLTDVAEGQCELGLCSDFECVDELSSLARCPLFREPLVLVVNPDHPFAGREKVRVEELADQRFITYVRSPRGLNKLLTDLCASHGFRPDISAEGYDHYGVLGMVTAGEGIALIPTSGLPDDGYVVPVALDIPAPLSRTVNLAWLAGRTLPPPVAITHAECAPSARSVCDSISRKRASPSRLKISGIVIPADFSISQSAS